jgi:hypothetical protein
MYTNSLWLEAVSCSWSWHFSFFTFLTWECSSGWFNLVKVDRRQSTKLKSLAPIVLFFISIVTFIEGVIEAKISGSEISWVNECLITNGS